MITPPQPLVRLDKVSVRFGSHTVFHQLSFTLYAGETLALIGANGAGKSTFFHLLQGELRPGFYGPRNVEDAPYIEPGRVFWAFDGHEDPSALNAVQHSRLVSSAQQGNYARQGWDISGEEILLSGIDNAPMVYGEMSEEFYLRADELAEAAGASHLLSMRGPAMSQGQLRLCLILRALMSKPRLLLLDEPFDGLDHRSREAVDRAVALAVRQGATLIVSAHRREDIPPEIHTALLLRDGALERVSLRDGEESARLVGAIGAPAAPQPHVPIFDHMEMAGIIPDYSPFLLALRENREPLVRLAGVEVYIDRQKVLDDINWQVGQGEQWVISGPNGSGKSTLLRLLGGDEFAAWGGTIEWCGGLRPALEDLRLGVGYVSDRLQYSGDVELTAEETVITGLRGHLGLYTEPVGAERELAREWLDRMGMLPWSSEELGSLSSGETRKVLLARALAGSPPVLLLDEPCSGLDGAGRLRFLQALPLLAKHGVSIIHVTHRKEDISPLFTHELALENGRVVYQGERR
jgi:molybdate transport system ATP-binding protein